MPLLWVLTLYAFIQLKDRDVKLFSVDLTVVTLFVLLYKPEIFLILAKTRPLFWLGLMLLYPIFSAYLHEILFRAFFFKPYKKLFSKSPLYLIFFNAIVFSYIHIIFLNWVLVIFTFIGGLLFAHSYLKTSSTLLVSVGLGYYFYHGGVNT